MTDRRCPFGMPNVAPWDMESARLSSERTFLLLFLHFECFRIIFVDFSKNSPQKVDFSPKVPPWRMTDRRYHFGMLNVAAWGMKDARPSSEHTFFILFLHFERFPIIL